MGEGGDGSRPGVCGVAAQGAAGAQGAIQPVRLLPWLPSPAGNSSYPPQLPLSPPRSNSCAASPPPASTARAASSRSSPRSAEPALPPSTSGPKNGAHNARKLGSKSIICGARGPKGLSGDALKSAVRDFAEQMKPHVAAAAEAGITLEGYPRRVTCRARRPRSAQSLDCISRRERAGLQFGSNTESNQR